MNHQLWCTRYYLLSSVPQAFVILSIILAILTLAKDYSEHHFFEISGKQEHPNFKMALKGFVIYTVIILIRLVSIMIIVLAFGINSIFCFITLVALNTFLYSKNFPKNFPKRTWTSFSAILAPTCFVAKNDVDSIQNPGKKFFTFYLINAFLFHAVALFSEEIVIFFSKSDSQLYLHSILNGILGRKSSMFMSFTEVFFCMLGLTGIFLTAI